MSGFRAHTRAYFRQWCQDHEREMRALELTEQQELEEWSKNIVKSFQFRMSEDESLPFFNRRESLKVSYGQADITPPLPKFEVSPKKKNKRKRNKERAELYKILADTHPDGVTMQEAAKLQLFHPEQLGDIKTNSVMQGVTRAIDRKKRQKWEQTSF